MFAFGFDEMEIDPMKQERETFQKYQHSHQVMYFVNGLSGRNVQLFSQLIYTFDLFKII